MRSIILSTLILAMTATVFAASNTCSATVSAVKRSGDSSSWVANGQINTIYDINAKNTGSCSLVSLKSFFYSDGYSVTSSWNYDNSTGKIDFGASLASQAVFNGAGFLLTGPNQPSQLYIRGDCGECGAFYFTATQAPGASATTAPKATPAATTAPTAAAPTPSPTVATAVPTPAPTIAPADSCGGCQDNQVCVNTQGGYQCSYRTCSDTVCPADQRSVCIGDGGVARCIATGSTKCLASVTVKARKGGKFEANGVQNQIYDIIVTGYSVSSATIEIDPTSPSSVGDAWNLAPQSTPNQYTLADHGSLSASSSSSYYGAGFVLKSVTTNKAPKVGVSSVTCV